MSMSYKGYDIETKRDGYGVYYVVDNESFSFMQDAINYVDSLEK